MASAEEWQQLLARAERAYARARELVYDVETHAGAEPRTPEQVAALLELEEAEAALELHRHGKI